MSLLNYLAPGTYTVVDHVQWDKQGCFARWTIDVFQDATKQVHLALKTFEVSCAIPPRLIKAAAVLNDPPLDAVVGDAFILGDAPTGAWEGRPNLMAVLGESGWSFWIQSPATVVYCPATNLHYQMLPNLKSPDFANPISFYIDGIYWNQFLSSELVFESDTNIVRQMYLLLKTLPGFTSCLDG